MSKILYALIIYLVLLSNLIFTQTLQKLLDSDKCCDIIVYVPRFDKIILSQKIILLIKAN